MTKRLAQPKTFTTAQAARRLHMTRRSVLRRIALGQIDAHKIGDGRTSAYLIEETEIERVEATA